MTGRCSPGTAGTPGWRIGIVLFVLLAAIPPALGYQEAPMLAQRVARGELPPVEQRLPKEPVVVKPVKSIGTYGGTWRRLATDTHDIGLSSRLGYDPIIRWDRSGKKVVPGFAKSWQVLDGGRRYVFRLREGMKWSDGHPVTSEDCLFWFEDFMSNKEMFSIFPDWLTVGGKPARMTAPGPYRVEFHFAAPYGIFLEMLAFKSGITGDVIAPKHYLRRFHPRYTPKRQLEKRVKESGLFDWCHLFWRRGNLLENPELPTLKAYQIKTQPLARRAIAERNPYYWKVDPEGNQLPYIDRIAFTIVQNSEVLTLKAMAGEVDFQARRIDAMNAPLFLENRGRGNYRVLSDMCPTSVVLYINLHSRDPKLRPILQDRRFRIALSQAINRKELIFLLYSNMARPSRGIVSRYDSYYLPEFDRKYLEYDPTRANALLDEVGLRRSGHGLRCMPDGTPFKQIINVYPSESGTSVHLWQLVADYFREVGLDFVVRLQSPELSILRVRSGNTNFWTYSAPGMHWVLDPTWYVPLGSCYFAPSYGNYVATGGKHKQGVKPPPEMQRLVDWYRELASVVGDEERKLRLGRQILRQWSDECYTIGICRQDLLTIVSNRFHNVPDHIIHDWRIMTPGYIGIEQFYINPTGRNRAK